MRHRTMVLVLAMGLALSACGEDERAVETPTATPSPSSATSGLPPEFLACMADQGYAIESADDVHSAPQQVLQVCFGSLHQDGGSPW